ncbi:MAG: NosD domain-containing protein [Methanothrix sp.]|uniref:Cell surface protein n=1 Tax=Methanothrix harundinacea TaxID=301375 RepID=A0A117MB01_9EURY|nr:MAG: Cell surface protein [Methanothrix harundinacea]KUK94166.1 MAG: Cell surface protein [Methanothrix harundinacea]MDD3710416.1 NosD domain-containing protein [Methanothrix sp.]MDD5768356.1 NosD domain-containing protein [Methanothrix sp.]MDI9398781.1 NosD domain-containing protein [Euryarchaeota archaeon]
MHRLKTSILTILVLVDFGAGALLVDGSGTKDFSKIQDAIDATEAGGEVVVLNGTYRENLVVDRPIALRGDGMPVVEGCNVSAPLITINASGVVLDGFIIAGCTNDSCDSGSVLILSHGSRIQNNTIYGSSSHGICVLNSTDHLISKNRISDNFKAGIRLAGVNDSSIVKNNISKNAYGVFIERSRNCWVLNSDVWGNGADGIIIAHSSGNELTSNSIHSNADNGIYLTDSYNNILVGNRIRDCINSGIDIYRSFGTMIASNAIEVCGGMGINVDSGDNNVMAWNSLLNNDLDGISILGSSYNTISHNAARNNRESGISLRLDSKRNMVIYNNLSANKRYGIVFDESDSNFVQANKIDNHSTALVILYSSDNSIVENGIKENGFGVSLDMVDNVVVSKNDIANSAMDGIRLFRCDNSNIWSNRILNSTADGIHIIRSTGTTVSDNDILGSGEYGVQVLDQSTQNLFLSNLIQNSGLGGIYLFDGDLNLIMSNALIDNNKFNGRDNGGNRWAGNYYSDFECDEMVGTMVCAEAYEIYGQRGLITLDHRPFINYHVILGR